MSKTLEEVCAELDVLTTNQSRTRIAVLLPPRRLISHDDEQYEVRRQVFVADWREINAMEEQNSRIRFEAVGAVVFPCHWASQDCVPRHLPGEEGEQPWILIKPEYLRHTSITKLLIQSADADREWWTTTGKPLAMGLIEEEAWAEDAQRTRSRKASATRKRGTASKDH